MTTQSFNYILVILILTAITPTWARNSQSNKFESQITQATHSIAKELKAQSGKDTLLTTIAVLPFKALDKKAQKLEITSALSELVSNYLSVESGIISVERAGIDRVIGELNRTRKGQISPETAAQAGKLIGARYVVLGSVSTLGADIQLSIRVVMSETGVISKAMTLQAPRINFVAFHKDVVVTRTRSGAVFRSVLLPGWGQLYNQDTYKGWITLSLTVGALATAGTYAFLGSQAEAEYQKNTLETVAERSVANQNYQNARLALVSAGVLWGYAVIDALLTGKSSKDIELKSWASPNGGGLVWDRRF